MPSLLPQSSRSKTNNRLRPDPPRAPIRLRFRTPERYHDFPAQATPLIGRQQELAAVQQMLARPEVRLLTLKGPAGIGKTRLAIEVAALAVSEFEHGASFVDLSALGSTSLVIPTIAQATGAVGSSGQPVMDSLKQALKRKHLLLVLDNFEQVVEAAADLSQLLSFCNRIKMLITSREALQLRWEHILQVPPLGLPDNSSTPTPRKALGHPAVALFVERSRAICSDFQLADQNCPSVVEICWRLDGLPLAIELAAARSNVLAPATMVELLQGRLDLLSAGVRDLPDRHQTLRGAIDWSYDLLSQPEQTLFRRLSAFVGGCTLDAARAIFDAETTGAELVDTLASLVNKSLLQREELPDGELRLRMLETVREYALERLLNCGKDETESTRRRRAEYYLELAEKAESRLRGPEQAEWATRLDKERDNLRATLRWCLDTGEADIGLRLCAALWFFWEMKGDLTDGRRWLEEALSRFDRAPASRRAIVLLGAGILACRQGDFKRAAELVRDSLAQGRALGDPLLVTRSLAGLGQIAWSQGDHQAALPFLEDSLTLAREMGSKPEICTVLNVLGNVFVGLNDYERARSLYEESLIMAKELGDKRQLARPLANLAEIRNDLSEAFRLGKEALALVWEIGDRYAAATILGVQAGVTAKMGRLEQAVRLFAAAEGLSEAIGAAQPPANRDCYDQHLDSARRQLAEPAYAEAWAAGRAMSPDEAVALVLEAAKRDAPNQPRQAESERLTKREGEVAILIAQGHSNQAIADMLVISKRTADGHVANILGKLGFSSRAQIAVWTTEQGLQKSNEES